MDGEYADIIDTFDDVDVSDGVSENISEDVTEESSFKKDVSDKFSEDMYEENTNDSIDHDEMIESIDEDTTEADVEKISEHEDEFEEDVFEAVVEESDSEESIDDILENVAIAEGVADKEPMKNEDISEDINNSELASRDIEFEEDIPEDIGLLEKTEIMNDEDTITDIETEGTTTDVRPNEKNIETESAKQGDVDVTERVEDIVDDDIESIEQSEDMVEAETTEEAVAVENTEYAELPEDNGLGTDNPSEISGFKRLLDYMSTHNYGSGDFATYSQDPQWRALMRQEYPDYELPELSQENASAQLMQYMNEHNYGIEDYAEYSQDPIWKELHTAAFPNDKLPILGDGKEENGAEEFSSVSEDVSGSAETQ